MPSRAQLLKRNAMLIAARKFMADNAINPDRVDLASVRVEATGDKSIQVRAEVMLTMPTTVFMQALGEAQERLDEEAEEVRQELLEAASTGPAVTAEEAEQLSTLGEQLGVDPFAAMTADENDDDGF